MPVRLLLALLLSGLGVSDRVAWGGGQRRADQGPSRERGSGGGGGSRPRARQQRFGPGVETAPGGERAPPGRPEWRPRPAPPRRKPPEGPGGSARCHGQRFPGPRALQYKFATSRCHLGASGRPRALGRPAHLPDPSRRWAPPLPGGGRGARMEKGHVIEGKGMSCVYNPCLNFLKCENFGKQMQLGMGKHFYL